MYAVSLATLMLRVRQRANLESLAGATSGFVPDAEVIDSINVAGQEFVNEVCSSQAGAWLYRAPWPITTTNGTSFYALAGNTDRVISVDYYLFGNGQAVGKPLSAQQYTEAQRNMYSFNALPSFGWVPSYPLFYQLQNDGINFIPTPTAAYAVVVNYVPTYKQLSNPSDQFNSWAGLEEFVVLDAAFRLALKDGMTDILSILAGERERQRQRVKQVISSRDATAPIPVRDVTGELGGFDTYDGPVY